MIEPEQLTYAAIITLDLPGMDQPATVTVTLTPSTTIQTTAGESKPLRDCSLAEVQAFADALEEELWARYRDRNLGELARTEETRLKITLLDDGGHFLPLEPEAWLEHAIVLDEPHASPEVEAPQLGEAEKDESGEPPAAMGEEQKATGGERAAAPEAETAKTEADKVTSDPETAPVEAGQTEAEVEAVAQPEAETAEEEAPPANNAEVAAPAGETRVPLPPPPEETPVVPGPEPSTAPAGVEPPVARRDIRIAGLRRPVGHPTPAAVDILINEPIFRNTQAHALTSLNREVAGMLIGPQPEKQPDGRYVVHITDAIIAKHTRMHGASVTYTPESWRYVTDVLQERYPNEEAIIVGWYHTHPGFGIFLSGMDLFIHQNFFTQKWHVALVLDPLGHKSGFFCWDRGQRAVQAYDFPWPSWAPGSW